MKNSIKMFFITAGVLILMMSGCYSFSGGRLDFKTVDIPVVENTTAEYRLPEVLTTTLIAMINADGRVKVTDPDKAETKMEVVITGYNRAPFTYSSQESVSQYKITITAKAVLKSVSGKILWENKAVTGWSNYETSSSDEEAGMKKAAENLAAEIIRQSLESW